MSNVARLVATGCDVNWSAVSGVWHWHWHMLDKVIWISDSDNSHTRALNAFAANLKQATLTHTHRVLPPSLYYDCQPHYNADWSLDPQDRVITSFQCIWIFCIFGLKCLFRPPKWGFWGLWRPPKGTSLRKSASFKLSTVKICWAVWPIRKLTESVMDTHTHKHTQTHR